jgi:phosphatidylinositol alpha-1,6-mannosyltransferase
LSQAQNLVSVSNFTAERFKAANPRFFDREIKICHLGAPLIHTPARHSIRENPFALIVGRLVSGDRYKGHDLLLELWPKLKMRVPWARLTIVGDGDDRPRLERKARDLRLENVVTFLGRVDDEALQALYRDCAFFLMPSSGEGFGVVFLEAMRAGKACVGGKGAPEEIIQDGVTGFIVPPRDPAALLEAMARLFGNLDLRDRMGQAGQVRFQRHFTECHFQQRFLSAVELSDSQV